MQDGMPMRLLHQVFYFYVSLLITDLISSLLCVIGGLMAPLHRREAVRHWTNEAETQQNGRRYDFTGSSYAQQQKYNHNGMLEMNYSRA
jgi:hypothetical protein